jgi:hypothetical protein
LAKNQSISANLDENSQYLRTLLLSKNVQNISDTEEISKTIRENLISKNILLNSNQDLEELSEKTRLSLLAKNESQLYGKVDRTATLARQNLLPKNEIVNPDSIERTANVTRFNLLSRNLNTLVDVEIAAEKIRSGLLAKNTFENNSQILDYLSNDQRNNLLAKNSQFGVYDIDKSSEEIRNTLLNKNQVIQNVMDNDFVVVRNSLLAKNEIKEINLDSLSEDIRNYSLSKNSLEGKVENDYSALRISLLSKNLYKSIDLDKISENNRNNLLKSNQVSSTVEQEAAKQDQYRLNLLARNNVPQADLEKNTEEFRNQLLSKNLSNLIDIDLLSINQRSNLIKRNKYTEANNLLDDQSKLIRDNALAKNENITENNLEKTATEARFKILSKNLKTVFDVDALANDIRNTLLSKNTFEGGPNNLLDETSINQRLNLLARNENLNKEDLESVANRIRTTLVAKNQIIDPQDKNFDDVRKNLLARNQNQIVDLDKISSEIRLASLNKNQIEEIPSKSNYLGNVSTGYSLITPDKSKTNIPLGTIVKLSLS